MSPTGLTAALAATSGTTRAPRGTIYRIAAKGAKLSVPPLNLETIEGQIEALKNPAMNVRYLGFAKLKAAGDRAVPALKQLLEHENPYIRVRALWLFAHSPQGRDELTQILKAPRRLRCVSPPCGRCGPPASRFLKAAAALANGTPPLRCGARWRWRCAT